ncbi:MAG TPA: hypothetical protein VLH19_03180 [Patescibacteria group bacterium]|nr:hypothetical protein [Patescibacteria group bacterium]
MARSKYKVKNMSEIPEPVDELTADLFVPMKQLSMEQEIAANETPVQEVEGETAATEEKAATNKRQGQSGRSKRYQEAHGKVDRLKLYKLKDAVELLKSLPAPKFDASVEAHLVLREIVAALDVEFPFSTGKKLNVRIFDDATVEELTKGLTNFDVLLATPKDMGKLTKFAKLLGPKGLMPNPKNGTLSNDPTIRKKQLEGGMTTVKGEKKSPLMHVVIGKLSMDTSELVANVENLLKTLGQGKAFKLSICSSMSPGIKVQL